MVNFPKGSRQNKLSMNAFSERARCPAARGTSHAWWTTYFGEAPQRYACGRVLQGQTWLLFMCLTLAACGNYTGEGRTPGEFIDDGYIERTVLDLVRETGQDLDDSRIKVVSMDAMVLLAGEVPSDAIKTLIEEQALKVLQVRGVHNELAVSARPSLLARTNDTLITSRVKARLLGSEEVSGLRIKVVTVNNVVYLMGKVSEEEGKIAAEVTADTSGVLRVVKLFEYVEPIDES